MGLLPPPPPPTYRFQGPPLVPPPDPRDDEPEETPLWLWLLARLGLVILPADKEPPHGAANPDPPAAAGRAPD
jgi:hypothetical protein